MADFTVTLPFTPNPGDRMVWGPLPEGDWVAPDGWKVEAGYLTTRWRPGQPSTFEVRERPAAACGLCGLPIFPDDVTISRRGLLSGATDDPDAHRPCYLRAVEEKVSAPGGPASPWPDPEPEGPPAWQPNMRVETGQLYTHNGATWRVVSGHTTAAYWAPGNPGLDALWAPA